MIVVMGMLFCIALYSTGYYNYMLMQRRLSDRLGRSGVLAKTAQALAILAIHKLQFGPLLAENSGGPFPEKPEDSPTLFPLFDQLSRPLGSMEPITGTIDLKEVATSDLFQMTSDLLAPLKKSGDLSFSLDYRLDPNDFRESGLAANGYPREKRGVIRLSVAIKFLKSDRLILEETYSFLARVKVTAALAPVISKFSLFIQEATKAPGEFFAFNQVTVDENGEIYSDSPARPLVLDNDGGRDTSPNGPLSVATQFADFVKAPRGLVYLGGPGTAILNLAGSLANTPSNAGETFQMFRDSGGDGFVPIVSTQDYNGNPLVIWQMEVGVSPSSHPLNASFYGCIRDKAPITWPKWRDGFRLEHSSVFRLMGVDANKSATLVLGNVVGQTLLPKVYSYPPLTQPPWSAKPRARLYLYENPVEFLYETEAPAGQLVPLVRAGLIANSPGEIFKYTLNYASFIATRPYNLAIPFLYNQHLRDPWTDFPTSDKLYSYFTADSSTDSMHEVPPPFQTLVPGAADLKDLGKLAEPLGDSNRFAFEIDIPSEEDPDLWTALQRRGWLRDNLLTISGWILVRSADKRLVLDRSLRLLGNGGIVLAEGDIILSGGLEPWSENREKVILQIVARQGNIRLQNPPNTTIQAALVAPNGRIITAGDPSLRVRGALAMHHFHDTDADLESFPGARLSYHSPLAALPTTGETSPSSPEASEKPLLSFSFDLLPVLLD